MRISDDTLDHVLKTCDDMAQPDKGNLYKLNLSSYLGERFARALAEDLQEARAALSKISRGPNAAPHEEPWSKAEAMIALSKPLPDDSERTS